MVHDSVVSIDVTTTSAIFQFLVKWVIKMVRYKNYETKSKFLEVMHRKL